MSRLASALLALVLLAACSDDANSQQAGERPPPQRVERLETGIADEIDRSRHTAITRAVEVVSPAVVSINVTAVQRVQVRDPFDDFFAPFFGRSRPRIMERPVQSMGSGFVISPDGYIVTNDHVAGNATEITVAFPDGRTLEATLIGSDPATDLALLKVEPDRALPYLSWSSGETVLAGGRGTALGNPCGLFQAAEPTVPAGGASAVGRDLHSHRDGRIHRDLIQAGAAINRGNSGGPLVNALGEVSGVNTAIISETGGSIGLGFAVPSRRASQVIDELRESGSIDRSYYIGLYGVTVTQRIASALGLNRTTDRKSTRLNSSHVAS